MSSYLAQRIEKTRNIEVLCNTTVRRMLGDRYLRSVEIFNDKTGEARTLETPAVFSFIGAVPRTDWLPKEIETDSWGCDPTQIDPWVEYLAKIPKVRIA
jgi:thioredoxin reductase (NADPH)